MALPSWVANLLNVYPPPSLRNMRLGPDGVRNPLMIQFFTWDHLNKDLSWWKHLEQEIPALSKMGFTQVWIPPPSKAMRKDGRGYDIYDMWDLGEFDQKGAVQTRWGTKKELLSASAVAKQYSVDIIIDAVLNHKMGADKLETAMAVPVDPNNRLKETGKPREIDVWTVFEFSGRRGKYSQMRWNQEHFTGVDWDNRTRTNQIYKLVGGSHKGWSDLVDPELGNFDYLLGVDIAHNHPEVRADFFSWGPWLLETVGASGFRIDAAKHIDRAFISDFITKTSKHTNNPKFFCVSECWFSSPSMMRFYIRAMRGQTAFFDGQLHHNFCRASKEGSNFDMRKIFDYSLIQIRPGDSVTFVDNHDTVPGATVESWVEPRFKIQAYALILLRSGGHPCVFYGDLYPNEHYDEIVSKNLKLLIEIRKKFAHGPMVDYFGDRNCIGFVREGESELPGCVVVMSNAEDSQVPTRAISSLRMKVGRHKKGQKYRSFFDRQEPVMISQDGWGTFSCLLNKVQVWIPE